MVIITENLSSVCIVHLENYCLKFQQSRDAWVFFPPSLTVKSLKPLPNIHPCNHVNLDAPWACVLLTHGHPKSLPVLQKVYIILGFPDTGINKSFMGKLVCLKKQTKKLEIHPKIECNNV